MLKDDRLLRGFVAGLLGGLVMALFNYLLVAMKISEIRYADWAYVFVGGQLSSNLLELIFGQLVHLAFAGFGGLAFRWIFPMDEGYLLARGFLWAFVIWFSANVISVLFQLEELTPTPIGTLIATHITAAIYGYVMVKSLEWLESRK